MLACNNGQKEIVKIFLDNSKGTIDFNAKDDIGWTAILLACRYGRKNVVNGVGGMVTCIPCSAF